MRELLGKIFRRVNASFKNLGEKKLRLVYFRILAAFEGGSVSFGKSVRIGKRCRFNISEGSRLVVGDNANIRENCTIVLYPGAIIILGSESYVGPSSEIFSRTKVEVGKGVLLAQQCVLIDYNHRWSRKGVEKSEFKTESIEIGDKTWLGLRVVVLAGVKIGRSVIVGAQEVVRRDLPDYNIFVNGETKEIL